MKMIVLGTEVLNQSKKSWTLAEVWVRKQSFLELGRIALQSAARFVMHVLLVLVRVRCGGYGPGDLEMILLVTVQGKFEVNTYLGKASHIS